MTIARHFRRGAPLAVLFASLALLGLTASPASAAETPAPGYQVFGRLAPTDLRPGHHGALYLSVFDTGAAEGTELTVTDTLPPGIEAIPVALSEGEREEKVIESGGCSNTLVVTWVVTCKIPSPPLSGGYSLLEIPLEVASNAEELNANPPVPNVIELSGGDATEGTRATVPVHFGSSKAPLGFADVDGWLSDAEGATDTQAGSHPYEFTFAYSVNSSGIGNGQETPIGEMLNLHVNLPPGIVGSAIATPLCSRPDFDEGACSPATQVGVNYPQLSGPTPESSPIYNLRPPKGVAAQFAFEIGGIETFINSHVHTGTDNATFQEVLVPERKILQDVTTIWGVPSELNGGGEAPKALLTNPTACGDPLTVGAEVFGTWADSATNFPAGSLQTHSALGEPIGFSGCERLQFEPSIEGRPTTNVADSPTGFDFDLHVPQNEDTAGLATSELKEATVTLPEGLVVNPSSANGLQACSEGQIGFMPGTSHPYEFSPEAPSCPEASKLGTIEVNTPLIAHPLPGSIYLAQQDQNPFGSLLAIYAVIDDPITGVVFKLPGLVKADPVTGRLTTSFEENPQQPFNDFHFDFFEGAHASLKTPATCGRYETTTALTPWSGGALSHPGDPFEVTVPAGGSGPCPTSEAAAPNKPAFSAGTLSATAGAYSPFVFKVSREDGSQRLARIETTLPPGLIGRLAGISYCPESAIAQAEHRTNPGEGAVEQSHPSCPVASEVGSVDVGAGAGPTPVYVSGHAYLAGPYKGAPLSLEIVTPAIAGPFDLGTVAVRTALHIDPLTTRITAVSDPLPSIIAGIPLDIRSVAVKMDRPDFTLNPTSCDPMSVTGSLGALTGQSAAVSNPFQVGECSRLGFKPSLRLSLSGQTHRAGHPGLKAVLTYPNQGAYANIAKAQVGLPHSEFLDQGNLNKVCTQPELKAAACPATSIYGHAKAWSPLLEAPVEGPVYLAVGFGYKLPALVAELDGQIKVLLVGKVDTDKEKGIRNTFEAVPDAPVSRFELTLKGGKKYGLLENSDDICKATQKASAAFTAQDGTALTLKPTIANSCGKPKSKRHGKGHGRG